VKAFLKSVQFLVPPCSRVMSDMYSLLPLAEVNTVWCKF